MKAIKRSDKAYKPSVVLDTILSAGIAFENVNVFSDGPGYNLMVEIYEDPDGTIEQTVRDVIAAHNASELSESERLQNTRDAIRDKRDVARAYAGDIAALYAAVIEADAAADTAQERYDRIQAVMANADAAFRSRFVAAMEAETGNGLRVLNLSIGQKQNVNAFARRFANSLTLLLLS